MGATGIPMELKTPARTGFRKKFENWESLVGSSFGLAANPHGHGHNYVLEVTIAGEPDPATGGQ